jgi:hypothetical protein
MYAAPSAGRCEVVKLLTAAGADVEAGTSSGATPLHNAVQQSNLCVVRALLDEGAEVDAPDRNGATPLQLAARRGGTEVVQLLLAADADLHAASSDGTALHAAIRAGEYWVVQLLLAAGAGLGAAGDEDSTPLHVAAAGGKTDLVQQLLRMGADPRLQDVHGETALDYAASVGRLDFVQIMLEAWGQPAATSGDLVRAAKLAMMAHNEPTFWIYQQQDRQPMVTFVRLAKELHKLYPEDLQELFVFPPPVPAGAAVAALLDSRASDVSGMQWQRAALRKQEEDVAKEEMRVQQLLLAVASMRQRSQRETV